MYKAAWFLFFAIIAILAIFTVGEITNGLSVYQESYTDILRSVGE